MFSKNSLIPHGTAYSRGSRCFGTKRRGGGAVHTERCQQSCKRRGSHAPGAAMVRLRPQHDTAQCPARGFPEEPDAHTQARTCGSPERCLSWYGNSWNFSVPPRSCVCWRVVKTIKILIISHSTYTHFLCDILGNIGAELLKLSKEK